MGGLLEETTFIIGEKPWFNNIKRKKWIYGSLN